MEGFNRVGAIQGPYSTIENYRYQTQLWTAFSALGNNPPSSNFPAPFQTSIPVPEQPVLAKPAPSVIEPPKEIEPIIQDTNNKSGDVPDVGNTEPIPDAGYLPSDEVIVCEYCKAKFDFRIAWSEHLRVYHDVKKPYICCEPRCNKAFIKRKSLDCHLRDFHHQKINIVRRKFKKLSNGKVKCDLCEKSFTTIDFCSIHRFKHFPPRLSCMFCDKKFYVNRDLQIHLKRHNTPSRRRKFDCNKCGKTFLHWNDYEAHGCQPDESLIPPITKTLNTKRAYNSNSQYTRTSFGKRHANTPRDYLCETCGNSFRTPRNLKLHNQRLHNYINNSTCNICSEKFKSPQLLLYHLKETHNEDPPEGLVTKIATIKRRASHPTNIKICEICGHSFTKHSNSFGRHMYYHYKEEISRQCKVCRTQLATKEELKRHLIEAHKDVDLSTFPELLVPQCQKCGQRFRSEDLLESHKKSYHQNEKQCPYCDKIFPRLKMGGYYTHVRTHTGLKPHVCQYCDRKFNMKCNLNSHVEAIHLKTAKNYCRQCKVIFVTEEKYQEHLNEKHTGFKFTCKLCFWGFDDEEKYNVHRRRSHRQDISDEFKPHPCKFCSKRYTQKSSLGKHYKTCHGNVDKEALASPVGREKETFHSLKNIKNIPIMEEFVCKQCFFVFASREKCHNHLKSIHEITNVDLANTFVIVCVNKKDQDNRLDNILDPFMEEEGNSAFKKYPYVCKLCHIFYKTVRGHDKHLESFHPPLNNQDSHQEFNPKSRNLPEKSSRSLRKKCRVKDSEDEEDSSEIEISDSEDDHDNQDEENTVTVKESNEKSKNIESVVVLKTIDLDEILQTKKELNDDDESLISLPSLEDLRFSEEEENSANSIRVNNTSQSDRLNSKGPVPNFFSCKVCKKLFSSEQKLEKHLDKSHDKRFKELDSDSNWDADWKPSKSQKPKKKSNNFSCKYCFQHFKKSLYLKQHVDKHHSAKNPLKRTVKDFHTQPAYNLFVCKICKLPYRSKPGILSHFENKHKDVKIPKGSLQSYREKLKEFYYAGDLVDLNTILKAIDQTHTATKKANDSKGGEKVIPVPIDVEKSLSRAEASVLSSNTVMMGNEKTNLSESNKFQPGNDFSLATNTNEIEQNPKNQDNLEEINFDEYLMDPTTAERVKNELEAVRKYMCKVCNMGWAHLTYLESHIDKWHPDYYDIYPKEKVVGAESIVKEVMEDVARMMNAKSNALPKSTGAQRKSARTKKPDSDLDSEEENSKDKEYDSSSNEVEHANQNYSSDSNSAQSATDLSTKPQDEVASQLIQPTSDVFAPATTQPDTDQSQLKNRNVPPPNREDILQNVLYSTGIANERHAATGNNILLPTTQHYNNQIYQNCATSFEQYVGINQNPIFPTPSFGERPEPQANVLSDWESIFTSPVKNKNIPVTTASLTNTYNHSGHLQNDHGNLPVNERPSNASHFTNGHSDQLFPGMTFQNQSFNLEPCLMTPQGGLHQPYLNPNNPSTSHHNQPNYSSTILQKHLIPLASMANYQGPPESTSSSTLTLIGEKSAPQTAQKHYQETNLAADSEREPCNVDDPGLGINCDPESSCDNPKITLETAETKKVQNDPISQTGEKGLIKHREKKTNKKISSVFKESKTINAFDSNDSEDSTDEDDIIPPLTPEELAEARKHVHICQICPMYYDKIITLITHYKRDHPHCVELIEELKKKGNKIEKDEVSNCHICQKTVKGSKALYYHVRYCHRDLKFHCDKCDAVFSRKNSLERHWETHKNEEKYQCQICQQKFKTISSFHHHNRYKHKETKPFSCKNCEKPFNTENGLKKHQENYCYSSRKCTKCDLRFSNRRSLIAHYYEHEDNRLKCPKCPRKFATERYLNLHIRLTKENNGVCKSASSYRKKRNHKKKSSDEEVDQEGSDGSQEEEGHSDTSSEFGSTNSSEKTDEDSLEDILKPPPKKKRKNKTMITHSRPSRACKPKCLRETDVDI